MLPPFYSVAKERERDGGGERREGEDWQIYQTNLVLFVSSALLVIRYSLMPLIQKFVY